MVVHPRESIESDLQSRSQSWYAQGYCSALCVASSKDSSSQCAQGERRLTIKQLGRVQLVLYHHQERMKHHCGKDRGSLVQVFGWMLKQINLWSGKRQQCHYGLSRSKASEYGMSRPLLVWVINMFSSYQHCNELDERKQLPRLEQEK